MDAQCRRFRTLMIVALFAIIVIFMNMRAEIEIIKAAIHAGVPR